MVCKVAIIKLCGKAGRVGAIPAVTTHDSTGKACIAGCTNQQRNGVEEAGIIQKLCTAGHGLRCLRGIIGVGGHALTGVGNLDTVGLAVFNKGILQTVGVVIVLGVDDRGLGKALVLGKQRCHLALIRINEAVAEDRRALQSDIGVGCTGRQQQHTVLGGLLCHGQCDRREETADDGLRRIRHDLVVGVHGLLGVLGIVCDLAAVDDFDLVAGVPGVDFLDSHINGILSALTVDGGAAGHRADNTNANDIILAAVGCRNSSAGGCLTGCGPALLGTGPAACQ